MFRGRAAINTPPPYSSMRATQTGPVETTTSGRGKWDSSKGLDPGELGNMTQSYQTQLQASAARDREIRAAETQQDCLVDTIQALRSSNAMLVNNVNMLSRRLTQLEEDTAEQISKLQDKVFAAQVQAAEFRKLLAHLVQLSSLGGFRMPDDMSQTHGPTITQSGFTTPSPAVTTSSLAQAFRTRLAPRAQRVPADLPPWSSPQQIANSTKLPTDFLETLSLVQILLNGRIQAVITLPLPIQVQVYRDIKMIRCTAAKARDWEIGTRYSISLRDQAAKCMRRQADGHTPRNVLFGHGCDWCMAQGSICFQKKGRELPVMVPMPPGVRHGLNSNDPGYWWMP